MRKARWLQCGRAFFRSVSVDRRRDRSKRGACPAASRQLANARFMPIKYVYADLLSRIERHLCEHAAIDLMAAVSPLFHMLRIA